MYLIRLDDACEYMDIEKWQTVEDILTQTNITPLVGIIPNCKDPDFTNKYKKNTEFFKILQQWQEKNWIFALHGYEHVFCSNDSGINPVHNRSEFAGLPLAEQKSKIANGYKILKEYGIEPKIFFAPAHTFDENTIQALKETTNIKIISDTIANDIYLKHGIYFLPQQSGKCRNLPFKFTTIALHPNSMNENDFNTLKEFIKQNSNQIVKQFEDIKLKNRKKSLYDKLLSILYFAKRKLNH